MRTNPCLVNTLRLRQNGRRFADVFKCILLNENVCILIEISLKFVPKGPTNNNPALFQMMAWRRPGDKPLSEPMMVSSLTHICVTRPQWVNTLRSRKNGRQFADFSNAFYWMKMFVFWLKFHWSLFLRVQLTIYQHWFRWWLGTDQSTSHYLNQWWLDSITDAYMHHSASMS